MTRSPRRQLAVTFLRLLGKSSVKEATKALAASLIREKRTHEVDLIVAEIGKLLLQQHGHLEATVVSARPLPRAVSEEIQKKLQRLVGARTVRLASEIDPALIGGVIVKTPEREFDFSVARQLAALRK